MKMLWSIIGAAFVLPLCAANVPHVPYTGDGGNLIVELIIKRCVENPAGLRNYFNVNRYIDKLLESEWSEKTNAWREKRIQHLDHWANAQTKYGSVSISNNGLRAAMSVKNFHPCDQFENPSHEITPFIEETKRGNCKIRCFICASVDEDNKISCEKYLYRLESRKKIRCNDNFAWLQKDDGGDCGLCYDFIKKQFSEVSIFVQCGERQICVPGFCTLVPALANSIKSALFKKKYDEISINLTNIAPRNKLVSLITYLEERPHPAPALLVDHLKNLTDLLPAYTILQTIAGTANTGCNFEEKIKVGKFEKYGTLFYSLIWDELSFSANNRTKRCYHNKKDTAKKLTPFAKARLDLFNKHWSCDRKEKAIYFKNLVKFFMPYTVVMVQNNKALRYDALNHMVRMLTFAKSDDGKVMVNDLGEVKVPENVKVNTLHIKKDGTLTYKTAGKQT
jgi:hypothetical protein